MVPSTICAPRGSADRDDAFGACSWCWRAAGVAQLPDGRPSIHYPANPPQNEGVIGDPRGYSGLAAMPSPIEARVEQPYAEPRRTLECKSKWCSGSDVGAPRQSLRSKRHAESSWSLNRVGTDGRRRGPSAEFRLGRAHAVRYAQGPVRPIRGAQVTPRRSCRAFAPLVQNVNDKLYAMAGMDPFRRQPPIGIRWQTLLFSHFSNALSARLNPSEQLPVTCGERLRHQPFLECFNSPEDALHSFLASTGVSVNRMGVSKFRVCNACPQDCRLERPWSSRMKVRDVFCLPGCLRRLRIRACKRFISDRRG